LSMAGVKLAGGINVDASRLVVDLQFVIRTPDRSALAGVMRRTADKIKTEVILENEGAEELHFLADVD
jgi:hypothetical protein